MDHEIDARTGDLTGARITGLHNAVYLRLRIPLGTWFGDRTLGSLLHRLRREKDTARSRKLAVQYAKQALDPLIRDGRALSITVVHDTGTNGVLPLCIEIVDAGGNTHNLRHNVVIA